MNNTNCPRCGIPIEALTQACSCQACGEVLIHSSTSNYSESNFQFTEWESSTAKFYPLYALVESLWQSFSQPDLFFKKVSSSKSIFRPLIYGLIMGNIGFISSLLWSYLFQNSLFDSFSDSIDVPNRFSPQSFIQAPFIIIIQIFLFAFYVYTCLWISHNRTITFQKCFSLICYAEGAMALQILPVIGTFFSVLLWIFLVITGIHQSALISKSRAFFTLLLPLFIVFFFVFAISVVVIGGIITCGFLKGVL